MATQAEYIRDLLVELLQKYDPTLDLSPTSETYKRLVDPISQALSTDPFDTDVESFLKTRLQQEYPSLQVQDGDAIVDVLIRPLQLLLEAFKRELEIIRTGQSVLNSELLRTQDAEALAGNFFVARKTGSRATGSVRVYFSSPTYVAITGSVRFTTTSGLVFVPVRTQYYRPEVMLLNRVGNLYFIDVSVVAESPGDAYNLPPGSVSLVQGLANAVKVSNLYATNGGSPEETAQELLTRTEQSLTERSLTTRRGIRARLFSEFPSLRNLEVVGYGDPEMQRDVLTGGGEGMAVASGICFIVGQYVFMVSLYENKGRYSTREVEAGDEIDLNFWKFLYSADSNERFTVQQVLWSSRDDIEELPTVYLLLLDGAPTITAPAAAQLPGVLPGVFATVTGPAKLEISGLAGGVVPSPEIVVNAGEVHIGGHYDVWLRPTATTTTAATLALTRSDADVLAGIDAVTYGESPQEQLPNTVYRAAGWAGVLPGMTLSILSGADAGSYGIVRVADTLLYLDVELTRSISAVQFRVISEVGVDLFDPEYPIIPFNADAATDLATNIGSPRLQVSIDLLLYGAKVGDTVEITEGRNAGRYTIIGFDTALGGYGPIVNQAMKATDSGLTYKVYTSGSGLRAPLVRILPGGITVQDASGRASNFTVPYAPSVGARAYESFSGAKTSHIGRNGFVLPDPGKEWKPESVAAEPTAEEIAELASYGEKSGDCYSSGCAPFEDSFIVVCTLASDGSFHIEGGASPEAIAYLQSLKDWFLNVAQSFVLGADVEAFINQFSPITFDPVDGAMTIVKQFEIVIPKEMFDGCNNTYVAIPEFQWENEFEGRDSLAEALEEFQAGEWKNTRPALAEAKPGDALTIQSGANAGSYIIDRVFTYRWYTAATIQEGTNVVDPNKAYVVAIVTIRGEFPVAQLGGLADYFADGIPLAELPTPPAFPVQSIITTGPDSGTVLTPWEVVQQAVTWLFQFLNATGFDLPTTFTVNPEPVLKTLVQSLFSSYEVGTPTAPQIVRMNFLEPTSVSVRGATRCREVTYNEEVVTSASILSTEEDLSACLPMSLTGSTFELTLRVGVAPPVTLTYVVTSSSPINTAGTAAAMATALQQELDPEIKYVQFTAPTVSAIRVTAIPSGAGTFLQVQATEPTDGFTYLGFTDVLAEGGSSVGAEQYLSLEAKNPSLFATASGTDTLLFAAEPGETVRYLWPTLTSQGEIDLDSLPRDGVLTPDYDEATASTAYFTSTAYPSPAAVETQIGDELWIHEQRRILDYIEPVSIFTEKRDSVVTVSTGVNSPIVTMVASDLLFLRSADASSEEIPLDDVQVGDVLFIEEGPDTGGYVITKVTGTKLTLNRPVTTSTERVIRTGLGGEVSADAFTFEVAGGNFSSNDLGKYLTIFAAEKEGVDGSWEITDVSGPSLITLGKPTAFDVSETELRWAVVEPPAEEPGESAILGSTALVGMRPIRIYAGTPSRFVITDVSGQLDRSVSWAKFAYGDINPNRGVMQPMLLVRPDEMYISATQMREQGAEYGLFYMDVPAVSLGGRPEYNLPKGTGLTPVWGTYVSEGYRLETADTNLCYSDREETRIVFSPKILPDVLSDEPTNRVTLERKTLAVSYEFSQLVSDIQAFLRSDDNRVLCADPLARHFLPAYVYLEIPAVGGNTVNMVSDITNYILGLQPTDSLDLSQIEKLLHANRVVTYRHPIEMIVLTHDLDRRIVMTRSSDLIDDSTILHNGTNRLTFFIPGKNLSGAEEITVGERIRITSE
jgi:hypothetical protein